MKKYLSKIIPVFIILWIFLCSPGVITGLNADQNKGAGAKNTSGNVGYLENVLFEKSSGREKISLVVSEQPIIAPPSIQSDNSLLIRLENLFVPDNMRQSLGMGQLLNIISVKAQQQTADGKQWVNLTVFLKENVPYSIRQEGKIVLIDFNISGIEAKLTTPAKMDAKNRQDAGSDETEARRSARREAASRYTDRIISLDFQEADIKSVLRLMAEYGNTSIVSGDDVKGNVTLSMKNVPWHQALDAIMKVHGLTKQQMGEVITIMTLERKKKDEKDKKEAEAEQQKAEEERKARELQVLVDKGKLRQILIEAKIVEASEEFVRNLGVQWGFGNSQSIKSYGLGLSGGTNS
jgi:type IV pilus assembly protein PilQ